MKKITIFIALLLINFNILTIRNFYLLTFTIFSNILYLIFFIKVLKKYKMNNNLLFTFFTNYILNQSLYIFFNYFKDYKISLCISIALFITTYYIIYKFKKFKYYQLLVFPYLILNLIFIFMSLKYLV